MLRGSSHLNAAGVGCKPAVELCLRHTDCACDVGRARTACRDTDRLSMLEYKYMEEVNVERRAVQKPPCLKECNPYDNVKTGLQQIVWIILEPRGEGFFKAHASCHLD